MERMIDLYEKIHECYERFYEVEANSKEEAEEKLIDAINEGRENPPDQCYDADAEATEMEDEDVWLRIL